jgi:hypothetical protein
VKPPVQLSYTHKNILDIVGMPTNSTERWSAAYGPKAARYLSLCVPQAKMVLHSSVDEEIRIFNDM